MEVKTKYNERDMVAVLHMGKICPAEVTKVTVTSNGKNPAKVVYELKVKEPVRDPNSVDGWGFLKDHSNYRNSTLPESQIFENPESLAKRLLENV